MSKAQNTGLTATAAEDEQHVHHDEQRHNPDQASPDRALAREQRQARSRTVFLMRLLLPAAAVGLVSIVIIWSQWQNIESSFNIGFSAISSDEAKTLHMVNPRYAGMSKGTQPFLLTAEEGIQNTPTADIIRLRNPKGDITTKNGAWIALSAPQGKFAQGKQLLDLEGGVDLFHDKGLHLTTQRARINLQSGTAEGNDPVTGNGPSINISGEGFKVVDNGARIIFTGKAKAVLYPKDKRKRKPAPRRRVK